MNQEQITYTLLGILIFLQLVEILVTITKKSPESVTPEYLREVLLQQKEDLRSFSLTTVNALTQVSNDNQNKTFESLCQTTKALTEKINVITLTQRVIKDDTEEYIDKMKNQIEDSFDNQNKILSEINNAITLVFENSNKTAL